MPVSTVDHPLLLALLRYWQTKCFGQAMPARRDIDPVEMGPALLPHLLLGDLLDRGTRVRFRLVGTTAVKRLGFDPTGKYLEPGVKGGYFDLLASLHRLVYCERAPLYSESEFAWGSRRQLVARHLLLPLAQDGPEPSIALVGLVVSSDEVFPPPLRALGDGAAHRELCRIAVPPLAASDPEEDTDRIVA
jgi:hypothetical protein